MFLIPFPGARRTGGVKLSLEAVAINQTHYGIINILTVLLFSGLPHRRPTTSFARTQPIAATLVRRRRKGPDEDRRRNCSRAGCAGSRTSRSGGGPSSPRRRRGPRQDPEALARPRAAKGVTPSSETCSQSRRKSWPGIGRCLPSRHRGCLPAMVPCSLRFLPMT